LELWRSIDDTQALALSTRVERRARERGDGPDVRARKLAHVAVHVIQTVEAGEIHLR
jgi:hypothetical protein